jgi:hypothetical protein
MSSPVLVLLPIGLCLLDISLLGPLIPTTEQQQERWATPRIVHTVARAIVDTQFPDTCSYRMRITSIAKAQPVKANTNPGDRSGIAQLE